MATYSVNMNNVQEVAAQMGVIAQHIKGLLHDLNDGATVHLAEWTADSRQAYYDAQTKWNAAAGQMADQAQIAQNSLSEIHNAYANAEYQGLGLWEH